MNDNFINLNEFINKSKKHTTFYQLQANKYDKTPIIKHIGEYEKHHVVPIYEFSYSHKITCSLLSFLISDEEIENNNQLKMLCFFVNNIKTKNKKVLGTLELIFEPEYTSTDNKLNQLENNINGHFKIIMTKNNSIETIKILKEYPGREESIYLLTSVLLEENVIKKIIKK